ncbi:ROK family protein [uncultured Duncaniella sp.]|uniref:ROK family protein n=1 Tax=uncultured Duncaniella sp. TaxID=2768039 RepID=UPI00272D3A11|nr:ROK family protein [uncultured Duncaniella sp.]
MDANNLYPPFTIGVDLGGTNTVYAIVDSVGHILSRNSFPTATPTIEKWADTLCSGITKLIEDNKMACQIEGIGIGAPCANAVTGCIEAATDLPWPSPIPLANMIEMRLGLNVVISNDANAAAIGEMTYGAAAGLDNFIVLTLGTGVGSGIVCDGHLLSGTKGFAGELGHMTFAFASDRKCSCGRTGCLQTVASAEGIKATAIKFLDSSNEHSLLRSIPQNELNPKKIEDAAKLGDNIARKVFEFTGECLGKAAAEFASITDPEAIILFGGVAKAGELLLNPMRKAFSENALHLYIDRVRMLTSGLDGADAAILGAASLPYLNH